MYDSLHPDRKKLINPIEDTWENNLQKWFAAPYQGKEFQMCIRDRVSPATVSRVLNHRELVKEPTIRRVEEAMRSLGCQIENTVTVSKETQPLIVLNIPGIENVFYQEIIRGARVSAKAHGCHLLIHESHLNKGNLLDFCNLLRLSLIHILKFIL